MENPNNRIVVTGRLEGAPEPDHEVMGEPFYVGTLAVRRLSGTVDRLPITIPGKLLDAMPVDGDALLLVSGQVRTNSKLVDGVKHRKVTLFAQDIAQVWDGDTLNRVKLVGTVCTPPVYRTTPFGREICDMTVAVYRSFGRSDYIPCIAWGSCARLAAGFQMGQRVKLKGRMQSREYQKLLENGTYETRCAYEVSAFALDALPAGVTGPEVGREVV